MSKDATGRVAAQYERWVYPLPEEDLASRDGNVTVSGSDPRLFQNAYWPQMEKLPEKLRILVAGCGSVAAARYAYNYPEAQVVGMDLSAASLAHEEFLKNKHGLKNLTLHQGPLQEAARLKQEFDLIDLTGVLHHIAEPVPALAALRNQLDINGVISIMVYGLHGRKGVYMLQDMFRQMGLSQDERGVKLVRDTLEAVGKKHFVGLLAEAGDLAYDSGLVDTFLHACDKGYTVQDCLDVVQGSGLSFQGWKENFYYYPEGQIPLHRDLREAIQSMDDPSIWRVMELFYGQAVQHRFHACRSDRDSATWRLDFDGAAFWDYIPVSRASHIRRMEGEAMRLQRPGFPGFTLQKSYTALFSQVDGKKSVQECIDAAGLGLPREKARALAHEFFRTFWRTGYLFLKIPA